jgi:hypothetical protein
MSELDTLLGRLRELATERDEQHVRIGSDVSLLDLRKAHVQIGREIERRAMGVALREVVDRINGTLLEDVDAVHAIVESTAQHLGVKL